LNTRKRIRRSEQFYVKMTVEVLEKEIFPMFNSRRKISHNLIHKHPDSKYFKMFTRITDYLKELKGDYKNPLRWLIKDYLISVYSYYRNVLRKEPYLTQLSPSVSNQIRFEDSIHRKSRDNPEGYWIVEEQEEPEIIEVSMCEYDLPDIVEL